jgi:hypothetical protein
MYAVDPPELLIRQLRAELAQREATLALRDATLALFQAELDRRAGQLETMQAQLSQLQRELEQRTAQLTAAQARIGELQAQLLRHFNVLPDPCEPGGKPLAPPKRRARSPRKRGAQPGHPGHSRALVPIEQVSEIVTLVPTHCGSCGHHLRGLDPKPQVHQVVEVRRFARVSPNIGCISSCVPTAGHLPGRRCPKEFRPRRLVRG